MHREADILQDRIEIAAFGRRVRDARKRVRGDENEQIERAGDPGLHGQHIGLQACRKVGAEQRDQRTEQREDQHPQEHGALVVPPYAGELVDQRHRRVRILEDVQHRKVGSDVAGGQRSERGSHEHELRQRRRARHAHQCRVVGARAPERHGRLNQRERERKNERVVPELRRHFARSLGRAGEAIAAFRLPVSLLLERVGHFLRHVGFVVLGEHGFGLERAARLERTFGHDALPFTK